MILFRGLVIAIYSLLLLGLAGCGWLFGEDGIVQDRREEYRQAKVVEPLKLPEGADNSVIRELYYIPGAGQTLVFETDKFKLPRPEIDVATAPIELKVYRSDNEHWIVLDGTPSQVWGRVQQFWELNDIELASQDPSRGLMETVWLKREVETDATRDKFQLIIDYGLQEGVSEVHIKHLGYDYETPEIPAAQLDWNQAKGGDPLAAAMTEELTSFLLRTENKTAPASLLAQKFVGQPKSSLTVNASGEWVIDLELSYARAWNAVAKAIDTAGFELKDRDREKGLYYVTAKSGKQQDKEGSFFSFLSFGGDEDVVSHEITIKVATGRDNKQDSVRVIISDYPADLTAPLRKETIKRIKSQLI
jgi:outer membrane protein assembly factor BamC